MTPSQKAFLLPLPTSTPETDAELTRRLLAHDPAAWRELHRRYDRLVYRCIHKVTGRFHRTVSSEDVQEIYALFLLNLTSRDMHKLRCFDPERGSKLGSWLGLLATHTAWDYVRSLSRRPSCTALEDAEATLSSSTASPFDAVAERERWHLVNETLQTFSRKDRTFVRMYYVDGRDPEEIARAMNISVKTVYTKKHKIQNRLEEALSHLAAAA